MTEQVQRVLVVDDHRTFADLLALALGGLEAWECVGEAHDADTARRLSAEHLPDVITMDVQLGEDDGIELAAELSASYPLVRIVVLTAHASPDLIKRAAAAGACALLLKDGDLKSVLKAMQLSRRDTFVVDPNLLLGLISNEPGSVIEVAGTGSAQVGRVGRPRRAARQLSEREDAVLRLMAEGLGAKAAADQLGISINTFRAHVRGVLSKLGAHSQLEAVAIATREGRLP